MAIFIMDSSRKNVINMNSVVRVFIEPDTESECYQIVAEMESSESFVLAEYQDIDLAETILGAFGCSADDDTDNFFLFPKEGDVVTNKIDEDLTRRSIEKMIQSVNGDEEENE